MRRSHMAAALLKDGADILDIGAASSNPDARPVAPETEIARLNQVMPALKKRARSFRSTVFRRQCSAGRLPQDMDYLNDIHGFADPRALSRTGGSPSS